MRSPGHSLTRAPEWAADEIRAALAWTRTAAYREYHFAHTLLTRLPAVFTALDTGEICRSKAWLFSELCAVLTDEQAQVVCDQLLPDAVRLTTGELAARIKKLAIALDPEWAARRYTAAVRQRDVIGYLDEDGTATVTGRRLPADQAAAACARIEDLAKAAKRAGYPGWIGALRADIYVGLLEGRWQHHTREEIITDLLASAGPEPTPQQPITAAPADLVADADPVTVGDAGPVADAPAAAQAPDRGDGAAQPAVADRVGVELRVGLSALLGRDRHPGEVPGWGPVTAETAQDIAAAQHSAEWRYAITDGQGQLILGGITRRRPTPSASATPCRGGVVELHLRATLITELAADPTAAGPWAAVIADLAAQYTTYRADQPGNGTGRRVGQDPAARFAGAALRRHVQIRDRYCVYMGCRCPARHADLDHTIDHSRGGATTEANSGPVCRHDHLLKHEGGWRRRGTLDERWEPVGLTMPQESGRLERGAQGVRARLGDPEVVGVVEERAVVEVQLLRVDHRAVGVEDLEADRHVGHHPAGRGLDRQNFDVVCLAGSGLTEHLLPVTGLVPRLSGLNDVADSPRSDGRLTTSLTNLLIQHGVLRGDAGGDPVLGGLSAVISRARCCGQRCGNRQYQRSKTKPPVGQGRMRVIRAVS